MTTPPGHNSRDPGVLFSVQEEEREQQRRRGRKWRLGRWSAKIKRDPIIGITTSQWAGKLSYLENTKAFGVHSWITRAHTHSRWKKKATGATYLHKKSRDIILLYCFCSCTGLCAHTHTLIPTQVWILIISLARPLWNYCSHLLMDEKTWSEKTQTYTNFSIKILMVEKAKEQNKRLQPKMKWLHNKQQR